MNFHRGFFMFIQYSKSHSKLIEWDFYYWYAYCGFFITLTFNI